MKANPVKTHFKFVPVLLLLVFFAGCAMHNTKIAEGNDLMNAQKYSEAVAHYQELVREFPGKSEYRTFLFRAKLNLYYHHLLNARKLRKKNNARDAENEYRNALSVFPDNHRLEQELEEYIDRTKPEKKAVFASHITSPVKLKVDPAEKVSLRLRSMPVTKIFKALGRSFKVNFIFDKDFRDFVYSIDVSDAGFFSLLNQLCMVASSKYRVLDSSTLLVYGDTAFKNRTFALKGVQVFHLSNIRAEDAKKIVLSVFREERPLVQDDPDVNSLVVKAEESTLANIERFLSRIDKEKSEVALNVEILEVNRQLIRQIGANFGDWLVQAQMGNQSDDGTVNSTINVDSIGDSSFFITVPSVAMNFLESDDKNKLIAKPNLRGIQGEEIKFMVGDEIPIPQTQFQSIAAGGINNSPVTTYEYKNVGVDIQITPFVHHNQEITLKIKLTMKFVTGATDNFPILGKRELENVIRLKEGETNIIGGFIKDEVRGSMNGWPMISKLPVLGRLFGKKTRDVYQSDLIFSITPRIIRQSTIRKSDHETIWLNTMGGGAGAQAGEEGIRVDPDRPAGSFSRSMPETATGGISIVPATRMVQTGKTAIFNVRLDAPQPLKTLSVSGNFSQGGAEIIEVNTKFLADRQAKVLTNHSGGSFDLGYTFTSEMKRGIIARILVKFSEKGEHSLNIGMVQGYTADKRSVDLKTNTSAIKVN